MVVVGVALATTVEYLFVCLLTTMCLLSIKCLLKSFAYFHERYFFLYSQIENICYRFRSRSLSGTLNIFSQSVISLFIFFFSKNYLFLEREKEKHQHIRETLIGCLSLTPNWEPTPTPCLCPEGSNWWPFGS